MVVLRCLYETLSVDQDADDAMLKKAYRKLALKWHPDKNPDNLAAAEIAFKGIVAAYETLIDPQERAWYNDHRDAILAGGDGTAGEGADNSNKPAWLPNLFRWFSASNYDSFEDNDERSFYCVYGGAFDEIYRVEVDKGGEKGFAPPFCGIDGNTKSVDRFYAFWSGFSTKLSFGWADIYNPNEVAVNRYQRRVVDKENSKARSTAKREYNEQVRSLVAWVKKRDKRMMKFALEKEALAAMREKERLQKIDTEKLRRKEVREAWFKAQEEQEEQIRAHEEATGERVFRLADEPEKRNNNKSTKAKRTGTGVDDGDNRALEKEPDVWVCEACSKNFKSEKQFRNHEKSKKHVLQVKQIKQELEKEEREIQRLMREEATSVSTAEEDASDEGSTESDLVEAVAETTVQDADENSTNESSSDYDSDDNFTGFGGRFGQALVSESEDEKEDGDDDDDDDVNDEISNDNSIIDENCNDDNNNNDREEMQEASQSESAVGAVNTSLGDNFAGQSQKEQAAAQPSMALKHSKAKSRRKIKKAMQSGSVNATPKVLPAHDPTDNLCGHCQQFFDTRNKLFKHMQETGHALAPDEVPKALKAASKKKKKGRR